MDIIRELIGAGQPPCEGARSLTAFARLMMRGALGRGGGLSVDGEVDVYFRVTPEVVTN